MKSNQCSVPQGEAICATQSSRDDWAEVQGLNKSGIQEQRNKASRAGRYMMDTNCIAICEICWRSVHATGCG